MYALNESKGMKLNMKKIGLIVLKVYGTCLILCCVYLLIAKLFNMEITETLEEQISVICFIISIPLYIIINHLLKIIKLKNEEKVKKISIKYNKIVELNNKFEFKNLGEIKRTIIEREYSHKGFDRARANSIILYQIENNENNIRNFILDAYRNKKIYDNYIEEYLKIDDIVSNANLEQINFSRKKYNKIENRIIKDILYTENVYNIAINVIVLYTTASGKNTYKKNRIVEYLELCDIYMQWRNGKKYYETSKRERKYLSDKMRYDVLKRDGFKCKKCGVTSEDGAKLHVDHIVPVSRGGITTISNLQTLCDRCNLGKSDRYN